jgi:hypothetical protein
MLQIRAYPYETWLENVHNLYSKDPNINEKGTRKDIKDQIFNYNIMHTIAYEKIMKHLKDIKTISTGTKSDEEKKTEINLKFDEMNDLYKDLYYYDQIYVCAHYIFNTIRNNGINLKGTLYGGSVYGGMNELTLEEFKEIIRNKIKSLYEN